MGRRRPEGKKLLKFEKEKQQVQLIASAVLFVAVLLCTFVFTATKVSLIINSVATLGLLGVYFDVYAEAFKNILSLKFSDNVIIALGLAVTAIYSFTVAFDPSADHESVNVFNVVVSAAAFLNGALRYVYTKNLFRDWNRFDSETEKVGVFFSDVDLPEADHVKIGLVDKMSATDIDLTKTQADNTFADELNRIFIPTLLVLDILLAAVMGGVQGFARFLPALAALLAFSVPLGGALSFYLPYFISSFTLRRRYNGIAMGQNLSCDARGVDTFIIRDKDIFPESEATLVKFNVIRKNHIAKVFEYAYMLLKKADSPLRSVLEQVVDLKADFSQIEKYKYIKGKGISAIIDGKHVLLGTHELLEDFYVQPYLETEHEYKLQVLNRKMVYVSVDGDVSAYFLIYYGVNFDAVDAIKDVFYESGITLTVNSNDCYVDEDSILARCAFREEDVKVSVPEKDQSMQTVFMQGDKLPAAVFFGKEPSPVSALRCFYKLKDTVRSNTVAKYLGIVVGLLLALISFFGEAMSPTLMQAVVFQGIWLLPITVLSLIKK